MYFQLAFSSRVTLENSQEGLLEAKNLINKHNGITAVFRTLYNFEGMPRTENAIIDKLFFDFDFDETNPNDSLFQARKLHEYLSEKGYAHSIFFSGRGFHIFLKTEEKKAREFHNPPAVTRGAHEFICQNAGVTPDSKTKDVLRVARVPNTMNIKSNLFCIPLKEEELYLSREEIEKLAKKQRHVSSKVEGKEFKIAGFDKEAFEVEYVELDTVDILNQNKSYFKNLAVGGLPRCMLLALSRGDCGYNERYGIITALRDLGFLESEVQEILRNNLTLEKYRHCIYVEGQLAYLYRRQDLLFPSCATLKMQGLCVEGCKGQNIYL